MNVPLGMIGHLYLLVNNDRTLHIRGPLLGVQDKKLERVTVLERVTGIEPAWPAWKAGALPLSYTRTPLARLEQV